MATITKVIPSPDFPNKIRYTTDVPVSVAGGGIDIQSMEGGFPLFISTSYPVVPISALEFEIAYGNGGGYFGAGFGAGMMGWQFEEASGVTADDVYGGNVFPLTASGPVPTDGVAIDVGAWIRARYFSGNTSEVMKTAAFPGGFGVAGDVTLCAIIKLEPGRTVNATVFSMAGNPANVANDDDNEQLRVSIDPDGHIIWYWECDYGGNPRHPVTGTTHRCLASSRAVLLTVIRRSNFVDVCVNGDCWERFVLTAPGDVSPSGGISATMAVGVGRRPSEAVEPFKGMIDSMALFPTAPPNTPGAEFTDIQQMAADNMMPFPTHVALQFLVGVFTFSPPIYYATPSFTRFYPADYNQQFVDTTGNGQQTILSPGQAPKTAATSIPPSVFDDSGQGFSVGSLWTDLSTGAVYYCKDNTPGAAVWGMVAGTGTPTAPIITSFDPLVASAVQKTRPISFEAVLQAPSTSYARIVILVSFPSIGLYEVAHDGDAFSQNYPAELGNVRNVIDPTLTRFTLLRQGGWPVSPRILPLAITNDGVLTDITTSIYAWTLVT